MLLIYSAHIAICALVILVILFQDGKTGGLTGVADNASQQVFGAKGAGSFLTKLTTGLAIAFMFTSLTLAIFHKTDDAGIAGDYTPDISNTDSPSVDTPVENKVTVPDIKGTEEGDVVITNKDGTKSIGSLNDAIKSIEVVNPEDVPESIKMLDKFDKAPADQKKAVTVKKEDDKKQN